MASIQARRRVKHSAEQMLALVADIERYPEFVPLCARHRVISRAKRGTNEVLITEMTIAYGVFNETIRVRDTIDRQNGCILLDGLDGPLRWLQGAWTFTARANESCDISLNLSYEFANPLLGMVLAKVLHSALHHFLAAFEQRADLLYARHVRRSPAREQALTA
jgi:coenzyme Q-binding protein COQ10